MAGLGTFRAGFRWVPGRDNMTYEEYPMCILDREEKKLRNRTISPNWRENRRVGKLGSRFRRVYAKKLRKNPVSASFAVVEENRRLPSRKVGGVGGRTHSELSYSSHPIIFTDLCPSEAVDDRGKGIAS
uniref:Uncharacterized protein n=1 Tax=Ananas comosus var. bracteatus TaxID=296719 RepID=A0A6V7PH64_ANACO|nr:unnamed protein product [Ananas comosus var. bracteatus]